MNHSASGNRCFRRDKLHWYHGRSYCRRANPVTAMEERPVRPRSDTPNVSSGPWSLGSFTGSFPRTVLLDPPRHALHPEGTRSCWDPPWLRQFPRETTIPPTVRINGSLRDLENERNGRCSDGLSVWLPFAGRTLGPAKARGAVGLLRVDG